MLDNLTLYRFFDAVAACGSISEAAAKLYVTQPAVSGAIKQLESALGTQLFYRTNKGIKPTPEGELLASYVRRALSELGEGEDRLRELSGQNVGLLRVGASDMTLRYYLLDYIERFCDLYPRVKLTITNAPTPVTVAELARGNLDFCIVSEPLDLSPEIACAPVREIRDVCIVGKNYVPRGQMLAAALAEVLIRDGDTAVTPDELAGERLITLDRGTSTRRHIDAWLAMCGAPESMSDPDIELATSDLIVDCVRRGIGIAFVMEDFAKAAVMRGEVREIKLKSPPPLRNFVIAKLKKAPLTAAPRRFIEMLGVDV
jgi:Transcriptional regulator